ncbi:MAG TPA: hypothetical protein VD771_01590 [Gemmatimonadaceae bacterium]|nr:hypothetical protein [Gemmatimonadaceae bacterium]
MSPLVDVAIAGSPVHASLRTPLLYDLFAPLSGVLDALTFLSPVQYASTFALGAFCFLAVETVGQRQSIRGLDPIRIARSLLRFLGGAVAVAGIMLIMSRPMASLELNDRDLLAVDFHSHTEASHDGRAGFSAERNRDWHQRSGFNAVYVTDHRTFDGALEGATRNPTVAGDGTVLLPGVELRDGDEHLILIGVDAHRMKITSPDWQQAAVAADGGPAPPILLLSLPGDIARIPTAEITGAIRVAGIETSDGSPRGMAQAALERDSILAVSALLGVARVSGSDNHGWGRAAPAWSVLRIPGWRDMTPGQLDIAIRRTILTRGVDAVQVIARRTAPPPRGGLQTALAGLAVGAVMLQTMSSRERASWIGWSWGLCFLSLRRARKQRNNSDLGRMRQKLRSRRRRIDDAAAARAAS